MCRQRLALPIHLWKTVPIFIIGDFKKSCENNGPDFRLNLHTCIDRPCPKIVPITILYQNKTWS